MNYSRDSILFRAQISEKAQRHDELLEDIKAVAKMSQELNTEERNLLGIAYKNVILPRRNSWKTLTTIEQYTASPNELKILRSYIQKVEEEIKMLCEDAIQILNDHLVTKARTTDEQVYYLRMKGDYYRYQAEFMLGESRESAVSNSALAYQNARDKSLALEPTHPTRLSLSLNYSVFIDTLLNDRRKAFKVAEEAYCDALDQIHEPVCNLCIQIPLILQLLEENLVLWVSQERDSLDTCRLSP